MLKEIPEVTILQFVSYAVKQIYDPLATVGKSLLDGADPCGALTQEVVRLIPSSG